jgi:predicted nucleic acid-binding protein
VTKYLLDTNVVSELRKPKPHGAVVAWIGGLRDDQLYISGSHDWRIAEGN